MNNNTIVGYRVSYSITVDHPERRDASFAPVEPGTKIHTSEYFASQGAAVAFFNALLAGEYDFSSEYVSKARVARMYAGRSPRCVRQTVERDRPARWAIDLAAKPANVRAWSLTDGTLFAYCEKCQATLNLGDAPCDHVDLGELAELHRLADCTATAAAAEKKAA